MLTWMLCDRRCKDKNIASTTELAVVRRVTDYCPYDLRKEEKEVGKRSRKMK